MKKAFKPLFLTVLLILTILCLFGCSKTKYYQYTGATMTTHEGTAKSLKVEAAEGEKFILISPAITVRTERDGSHTKFVGWQIKGKDTVHAVGETLTMTKKNMTLVAIWKDAYQLTFANADQSATGSLPSLEEEFFAVDEQITLPDCTMTKPGYTFGGWKDASGSIYPAKSTFVMPNANATLTATWTNVYTLVFLQGAEQDQQVEGVAPVLAPRELGASVYIPKCTFTSAGYDFVCWKDQNGNRYNVGESYVVTGDTIFTAVWQKSSTTSNDKFDFTLLADGTYKIAKTSTATLSGNLVLPETFEGKTVTVIAPDAFKSTSIESVTIPASVTEIGKNAFYGCTKLTTVILEDQSQLTYIQTDAFNSCAKLSTFGSRTTTVATFALPQSIKEINANAFFGCNLKTVTLSNNLTTIGVGAFAKNPNLTLFDVNSPYFKGGDLLTNPDGTVVYAFAYASQNAKSVNLSQTTEICDYAFAYATNLETLTLGAQVQKIGSHAFANCSSLKEIVQAKENSLNTLEQGAFLACGNIKNFYIGKNLINLDLSAFDGCIGISAFEVHSDNTAYGTYADNLYTKDKTVFLLYATSNENSTCTLHQYTTTIGKRAFQYGKVEQVLFQGDKTKTIKVEEEAFYHCSLLRVIDFWNQISSIGDRAFEYCSAIDNVVLGNNLTSLGKYAFYYCEKLAHVTVADSCQLKTIPQSAFANCGLTKFDGKGKIETIEQNAFGACSQLSTLILDGVTTIKFSAFASCENLTQVTLPASVAVVEGGAFKSCKALTFAVAQDVTSFSVDDTGNLYNADKTELLFCANKNALTTFILPSTVKIIAPYVFFEYPLTVFDAKNSALETIGEYAFANCASLDTVLAPATLKTIKQSAFEKCVLLTKFDFVDAQNNKANQRLQKIEKNAFKNCVRLNIYLLGDNLPVIDPEAFYLDAEAQTSSYKPSIYVDSIMLQEYKTRFTAIANYFKAYTV